MSLWTQKGLRVYSIINKSTSILINVMCEFSWLVKGNITRNERLISDEEEEGQTYCFIFFFFAACERQSNDINIQYYASLTITYSSLLPVCFFMFFFETISMVYSCLTIDTSSFGLPFFCILSLMDKKIMKRRRKRKSSVHSLIVLEIIWDWNLGKKKKRVVLSLVLCFFSPATTVIRLFLRLQARLLFFVLSEWTDHSSCLINGILFRRQCVFLFSSSYQSKSRFSFLQHASCSLSLASSSSYMHSTSSSNSSSSSIIVIWRTLVNVSSKWTLFRGKWEKTMCC